MEREQKALLELLYKEMYAVLLSYACASLENEMLANSALFDHAMRNVSCTASSASISFSSEAQA